MTALVVSCESTIGDCGIAPQSSPGRMWLVEIEADSNNPLLSEAVSLSIETQSLESVESMHRNYSNNSIYNYWQMG